MAWEVEKARVALQIAGLDEQWFALRIVAKQMRLSPRNLYFRLRRHNIPYRIGPKSGSPGREVWVPEYSLPLILDVVWKKQIKVAIHLHAMAPVSSGPVRARCLIT